MLSDMTCLYMASKYYSHVHCPQNKEKRRGIPCTGVCITHCELLSDAAWQTQRMIHGSNKTVHRTRRMNCRRGASRGDSVHEPLQRLRDDLVRCDDFHDTSPACEAVPVYRGEQALCERLEEFVLVHTWSPEGFADAEKLL